MMKRVTEFFRLIFASYPVLNLKGDYETYWDKKRGLQLGKLSSFQKKRLDLVANFIKPNSTLLDIGSGDSSTLKYLLKKKKFKFLVAADISLKALSKLKAEGFETLRLDVENQKALSKLSEKDYILMMEILEHTKKPEEILLSLLSKANNAVIFSVPNTGFIVHRLRLIFGSFPLQWVSAPWEHLRFWTYKDMKWWLKELQLCERTKIIPYEGIPFLNKIFPGIFAMGIIVVIKK